MKIPREYSFTFMEPLVMYGPRQRIRYIQIEQWKISTSINSWKQSLSFWVHRNLWGTDPWSEAPQIMWLTKEPGIEYSVESVGRSLFLEHTIRNEVGAGFDRRWWVWRVDQTCYLTVGRYFFKLLFLEEEVFVKVSDEYSHFSVHGL